MRAEITARQGDILLGQLLSCDLHSYSKKLILKNIKDGGNLLRPAWASFGILTPELQIKTRLHSLNRVLTPQSWIAFGDEKDEKKGKKEKLTGIREVYF